MKKDNDFTIRLNYIAYAPPEKVFEALTDSGIIAAWGGGMAIVEGKEGGHFEMFDGWVKGEVLVYKPGKELQYSWKPSEWDKKTAPSKVSYKLVPHAAGTEIILNHTEIPTEEEADKHRSGWIDFIFDPLNDYFTS
jgi:uncharacterized protein YndB with AHSA1/START domain